MNAKPKDHPQPDRNPLPRQHRIGQRLWREWLKPILTALILTTAFRSAIADWNDVPTGSMKPTVLEGDRVFVNRLAYDLKVPYTTWRLATWSHPERGDIVVLYSPADGTRLLKRVVGLPGDRVEMDDNRLCVNGRWLNYRPLDPRAVEQIPEPQRAAHQFVEEVLGPGPHPVMLTPASPSRRSFRLTALPDGQYLVMGDNRDLSFDSRYFGLVRRSQILGRATAVAMSFDPAASYRPRWERFCTPLQ